MRKMINKKRGGARGWSVLPDKPMSSKPYIDYASSKVINANSCQVQTNASATGKAGGGLKKKSRVKKKYTRFRTKRKSLRHKYSKKRKS